MFGGKNSIVISLGDDGAILTRFSSGKLIKRAFSSSAYSSEFNAFIKEAPDDIIYLLLDTVDQNYIFSNLPSSVNSKNQLKIVKRKLQNEFDQNDLNSYMNLGKDDSAAKKDIRYLFISVRMASPLTEWLEVIHDLPNKFGGIYLLPIESTEIVNKLDKLLQTTPAKKGEVVEKWHVLISHNRVGGFRQIVFKNGKIIFTRISQNTGLQSPDAIGVNITQEASNTLEYIRRIGFTDQNISVYVVAAKDSFQFIEIPTVSQKNVHYFSPLDLAQKLALKDAAQDTDKFADVVIASNFITSKKRTLKISTQEARESEKFIIIEKLSIFISFLLFLLLPIFTAYSLYEAFSGSSDRENMNRERNTLAASISSIQDFEKEFGIEPRLVNNIVKADDQFSQSKKFLLETINKISKIDVFSNGTKEYIFDRDLNSGKFSFVSSFKFDDPTIDNVNDIIYKTTEFEKAIKEQFVDYQVTITGIPDEKSLSQIILEKTKLNEQALGKGKDDEKEDSGNGILVEVRIEK